MVPIQTYKRAEEPNNKEHNAATQHGGVKRTVTRVPCVLRGVSWLLLASGAYRGVAEILQQPHLPPYRHVTATGIP